MTFYSVLVTMNDYLIKISILRGKHIIVYVSLFYDLTWSASLSPPPALDISGSRWQWQTP